MSNALSISGVNSAGKSLLLQKLRADKKFAACTVFEMDETHYWCKEHQITPKQVLQWFSEHASADDPTAVEALKRDIVQSSPEMRTIKLTYCKLCASGKHFVTVTPFVMRSRTETYFFNLLQQAWGVNVHHIALLPSVFRLVRNIVIRKDTRWKWNIVEYLRIRFIRRRYSLVVHNRWKGGIEVDVDALLGLLRL